MGRTGILIEWAGVVTPGSPLGVASPLLPGAGEALARFRIRAVPVVILVPTPDPHLAEDHAWKARSAQVTAAIVAAGGAVEGFWRVLPGDPPALFKPRPGLILRACREAGLDLQASWLVGTDGDAARAAGQAGLAGAVLVGPADLPSEDLGCVVAKARDVADAPRVMIPRGGGCWHDQP